MGEQEVNLQLWNELMRVPHGDIPSALEVHGRIRDANPLFYVKCASWYNDHGDVRDHKVAFVRTLFESQDPILRDAAWALLQELPLPLVGQVVLEKNARCLRGAVIHYLASMDEGELSYHLLRGSRDIKRMVRRLHIPTSRSDADNLRRIGLELFSKKPELRSIFRKLEQAETPTEVADLLRTTSIPAYIAVSAIKVRTPEIMRILIRNMSVNELLQSLNSLGKMGAIRPNMEIIRGKIQRALDDRRLNIGRIRSIQRHLDAELVPAEIFDNLTYVTRERARRESRIEKKVAIIFDTSGSMSTSITTARQLAVTLAIACKTPPLMFTASQSPYQIRPEEWTFSHVERQMDLIRPVGGTPLGSGLALLRRIGEKVDGIILISDLAENQPPFFITEFEALTYRPNIILVHVPGEGDVLSHQLRDRRIDFEMVDISTVDQYSIDQIVDLVGRLSPFETILDIMAYPIPERPTGTKKPNYWKEPMGNE